jgi:hypothetical protein
MGQRPYPSRRALSLCFLLIHGALRSCSSTSLCSSQPWPPLSARSASSSLAELPSPVRAPLAPAQISPSRAPSLWLLRPSPARFSPAGSLVPLRARRTSSPCPESSPPSPPLLQPLAMASGTLAPPLRYLPPQATRLGVDPLRHNNHPVAPRIILVCASFPGSPHADGRCSPPR